MEGDTGGWGVQRVKVKVDALFEVNPIVSYKKENRTDNNKMGRTFEGLQFSAVFGYESLSPSNPKVELSLIAQYQKGLVRQSNEIGKWAKDAAGNIFYKISIAASKENLQNNYIQELRLTGKPLLNQGVGNFVPFNAITPMIPISMRSVNIVQPLR